MVIPLLMTPDDGRSLKSYAEVAVNSPGGKRGSFSYAVPPQMAIAPGQAVWVPFGAHLVQGIIMKLTGEPLFPLVKEIAAVISPDPLITPTQITLALWMSKYYLCPIWDAVAQFLPPGFERRLVTRFSPIPDIPQPPDLTEEQNRLFALIAARPGISLAELITNAGKHRAQTITEQLIKRRLITKFQELQKPRTASRMVSHVEITFPRETLGEELGRLKQRAPKQAAILRHLSDQGSPIPVSELAAIPGGPAALRALTKRGLVRVSLVRTIRDPLARMKLALSPPPSLTNAQDAVCRAMAPAADAIGTNGRPMVYLLYGITGSGKTEVYLRLLEETIRRGKRGICMVPEISLTPQTIERFYSRFPGRVAVMHSHLSAGEQYDEWQRIGQNEFDVVIGPRGALFSPQPNTGLIILDEEHEWTYKQQDKSPRYHSRDVAIKYAELTGSVVVLGSATPDVETYYRSEQGDYRRVELHERITPLGVAPLPHVDIIDMKEELKAGNSRMFSSELVNAVKKALAERQQVILFLNRRGTATLVQCRNCSYIPRCPRCSVALTYHSPSQRLVCHRCRYSIATPTTCPQCNRTRLKFLGVGTEAVESEAKAVFPLARVLRWDRDTTTTHGAHETIMAAFREQRADILVGTQMIAKGLDMPLVTVAGIVNADTGLNVPDFRASERTFQLLCQVAGRAGRGRWPGRVIVQTFSPEHYAIRLAASHDYPGFFQKEIAYRRQFNYPPFSRLVRVVFSHTNASACRREAERLASLLAEVRNAEGISNLDVIGPSPAPVARLRGRFRWQLMLRGDNPAAVLSLVTLPQAWSVDVDPLGVV